MTLLIEIIVLVIIFGILGLLAIYAYDGVMKLVASLKDLATLQTDILQLEGLINELKQQFATIKETFSGLGDVFIQIEKAFSGIFSTFDVLRSILGPVCSITKVSGKGIASAGGSIVSGITNLL
jgi:hypothetical protein